MTFLDDLNLKFFSKMSMYRCNEKSNYLVWHFFLNTLMRRIKKYQLLTSS
jgi:hypothetical protein